MRTTIDKAGRLVLPKALRDQVGIVAGEVEVTVDGSALRVEPPAATRLVERDGLLLLPSTGRPVTAEEIRKLRLADQR
ncbi:MAG: AbrB/MazE/SpoVT family DNA-binding domain-containing protein [Actinomycetes bacterium]